MPVRNCTPRTVYAIAAIAGIVVLANKSNERSRLPVVDPACIC
jgi:hypothetical protein